MLIKFEAAKKNYHFKNSRAGQLGATFFHYQTPKKVEPHSKHSESTGHQHNFCQGDHVSTSHLCSSRLISKIYSQNPKMLMKILVVERLVRNLARSWSPPRNNFWWSEFEEISCIMGQIQKFMKKFKIDFLRVSKILYFVHIQLYYVWVLDFRELSKSLWYLSPFWRFWNNSSDTYFWLLGRNYLSISIENILKLLLSDSVTLAVLFVKFSFCKFFCNVGFLKNFFECFYNCGNLKL